MSDVEDSVENYQLYLAACCAVMVIFMLIYVFTHIFFHCAFDRKPDKLLSRTLHMNRVAAHVILKVREEDAMNSALFVPSSNGPRREKTCLR